MSELYRLKGESRGAGLTLILTESHLLIEPTPEFRTKLADAFTQGREGAEKAPGLVGWIVEKATNLASNFAEKIFQPHELKDVEIRVQGDNLGIKLGKLVFEFGDVKVDPAEAYIFDAKFRAARGAR